MVGPGFLTVPPQEFAGLKDSVAELTSGMRSVLEVTTGIKRTVRRGENREPCGRCTVMSREGGRW